MSHALKILMAQLNPVVGAVEANAEKICSIVDSHQLKQDVIVFPELALTGYPPEDLLLRYDFHQQVERALKTIERMSKDCFVIVGHPSLEGEDCFNSASIFYKGERIALYHKHHLPNYGVFDEKRYFKSGEAGPCILSIRNYRFGVCICEDLWFKGPVDQLLQAKVDGIFCLNASPFDDQKQQLREDLLAHYSEQGTVMIYVNQVGGQDELVFDGQSMVFDAQGKLCARAPAFQEVLHPITFNNHQITGDITPLLERNELIYKALVCGTRDYVEKNGFPGVLLGLSGGIDSALTLAIAVDALGASRVHAVMMPSRYTADISLIDARKQLNHLNVASTTLSIESVFSSFLETLEPVFAGFKPDTTEENIQARIRGVLLMALSNKTGKMVLTTSNKSETAVGYATLYGDMAGGFAVLKDVLKTQVYALARYRNLISPVIPERVITRAPSAELAKNQTDQDSLPDYATLDAIIHAYMENNVSAEEIIRAGYPEKEVWQIIRLIKRNEYKRRQAAPGIKISPRAFGRDWRMPITSNFTL
ncbi:NAD+ synthase [Legionella hackeliae]|uniref:Glutamine-dependent NAD(+) synthetase n=1 Tax=Legionella hackeliae TaxID=449 RepID=A0A0A8UN92_LEGHA|nr:NAD+ synthase [Legionella hackeliae]KTD08769.1 glutamine dependent NAD+ synthetase [Legionella hackeliae]CEK10198.1 putative glutamine-dependent NAD(+) synthetase [Legionella hackeliae]STX46923.1 NAD synthase (glutamine-hydrolysing) [Legionella hackeliae]